MFDHEEIAYDETLNQEIEKAQQEAIKRGETFEHLLRDPAYQLAKALLSERFIQRIPSIPNNQAGMYEAFGMLKFRQGIQFVFDFVEGTVALKNQFIIED
ncbi:MAG: hypothetical protein K2X01_11390 [Cyanobacteria bacterium]|nr:hypothetical protein [Cyanobacteriota bacterium]